MSERVYPRQVWVLMPSFKPVQITVVKKYYSWGSEDYGDITDKGKLYRISEMYDSFESAVFSAKQKIGAAEVTLALSSQKLEKKRAALKKAEDSYSKE